MVVIVHGYDGSGPGHWQRWLDEELRIRGVAVEFPELPDPQSPECDVWVAQLHTIVSNATAPVLFVAHSLGCWAVDHLLARYGATGIDAALLVAPPSPYLLFEPVQSFFPAPQSPVAWAPIAERSLLVTSDDDPYIEATEAAAIGQRIGVPVHMLAGAGHINVESGFGPWPFALQWVLRAFSAIQRRRADREKPCVSR